MVNGCDVMDVKKNHKIYDSKHLLTTGFEPETVLAMQSRSLTT
jgi:hypothetical protein